MAQWLMTIVGVVSVGVLLDIIIPDGEINKYIRGIFGIVVVLVIVAPIPKLFNKDYDYSHIFQEQIEIDEEFVDNVKNEQMKMLEKRLQAELSKSYPVRKTRIYTAIKSSVIETVKVYIDTSKISGDFEGVKSEIINKVVTLVNVERSGVKVYAE